MKKLTILLAVLASCLWGGQAMAYGTSSMIDLSDYSQDYHGYESGILTGNGGQMNLQSSLNTNSFGGTTGTTNPNNLLDRRLAEDIEIDDGDSDDPETIPAIPEPMTLVLVGFGLAGAGLIRKFRS